MQNSKQLSRLFSAILFIPSCPLFLLLSIHYPPISLSLPPLFLYCHFHLPPARHPDSISSRHSPRHPTVVVLVLQRTRHDYHCALLLWCCGIPGRCGILGTCLEQEKQIKFNRLKCELKLFNLFDSY